MSIRDTRLSSVWQAACSSGVQVFGAGGFARDLARALQQRGVQVRAFLTSAAPSVQQLDGLPLRQVNAQALSELPLWIGLFNRESHSDYAVVEASLRRLHARAQIVWPQLAYGALSAELGFRFWLHPQQGFADVMGPIVRARSLLEDEASRSLFDQLLAFRCQASASTQPPAPQPGVQYLPGWLREHLQTRAADGLRIVDAGAYQGETLDELAGQWPIAQAWSFEPDAANHAALVHRLADWPVPVTHIPAGLSDRCGFAAFTPGQGEASRFSDAGSHHVPIVALDECLHRAPVNFLKLDVEGHELAALAGARATLRRERPVLAVAGYHRWDDLWRIPGFIAETGLNYRIRIGLHGHNSFDTVFYAY